MADSRLWYPQNEDVYWGRKGKLKRKESQAKRQAMKANKKTIGQHNIEAHGLLEEDITIVLDDVEAVTIFTTFIAENKPEFLGAIKFWSDVQDLKKLDNDLLRIIT